MEIKGLRRVTDADADRRGGALPSLAGGNYQSVDCGRYAGRPADGMDGNGNGAAIGHNKKGIQL